MITLHDLRGTLELPKRTFAALLFASLLYGNRIDNEARILLHLSLLYLLTNFQLKSSLLMPHLAGNRFK